MRALISFPNECSLVLAGEARPWGKCEVRKVGHQAALRSSLKYNSVLSSFFLSLFLRTTEEFCKCTSSSCSALFVSSHSLFALCLYRVKPLPSPHRSTSVPSWPLPRLNPMLPSPVAALHGLQHCPLPRTSLRSGPGFLSKLRSISPGWSQLTQGDRFPVLLLPLSSSRSHPPALLLHNHRRYTTACLLESSILTFLRRAPTPRSRTLPAWPPFITTHSGPLHRALP